MTANGNRPEDNNYVVDGLDDNDAYYGTTVINAEGVEGTPATHLPIDAIQEFSVQLSPKRVPASSPCDHLNHPNFANPDHDLSDGKPGRSPRLTSTNQIR